MQPQETRGVAPNGEGDGGGGKNHSRSRVQTGGNYKESDSFGEKVFNLLPHVSGFIVLIHIKRQSTPFLPFSASDLKSKF